MSRPGARLVDAAYGYANRALRVRNTMQMRFAMASGSKGLTALAVGCLVHDGDLWFETTARQVLGDLLPEVDGSVTIRHLLGHTSGIGDYLDEDVLDDVNAYVLAVPVHELACPTDFVRLLAGHRQKFPPGGSPTATAAT